MRILETELTINNTPIKCYIKFSDEKGISGGSEFQYYQPQEVKVCTFSEFLEDCPDSTEKEYNSLKALENTDEVTNEAYNVLNEDPQMTEIDAYPSVAFMEFRGN